jgi:hypothetical protein
MHIAGAPGGHTPHQWSDGEALVRVELGTAGANTTATISLADCGLGTTAAARWAYAEVLTGVENTNLVTKVQLPAAAITANNLVLTEAAGDGFEDNDVFYVRISQHQITGPAPTMS